MVQTQLVAVDEVKVTIIMDNTIDVFMANEEQVHRFDSCELRANDGFSPLIAEHGFSALVQMKCGENQKTVLLDAGVSPKGILHNMRTLGIQMNEVQAIVLSHGHADHTLGLPALIEEIGSKNIPLMAHPDAFLERKVVFPGGREMNFSPPQEIIAPNPKKISLVKKSDPTYLADQMLLVSGEIPRITDFETGFPYHYTKRNGKWEHDPVIKDDQCLIVHVRGKGLVIITGCGHSGIINTLKYAQALSKVEPILAVVGGFHLTGKVFENQIPVTVAELQKINPTYLIPGHCTGWAATQHISQQLPEAFIPNNVGTTLIFNAN